MNFVKYGFPLHSLLFSVTKHLTDYITVKHLVPNPSCTSFTNSTTLTIVEKRLNKTNTAMQYMLKKYDDLSLSIAAKLRV